MLNNIFDATIFLRNMQNRPFYIVHSTLDDLRPVEQARVIIDSIKQFDKNIIYKEFYGYKHFDKHLQIDMPSSDTFMHNTVRNPFAKEVYWESNNARENGFDWITVDSFDLNMPKAPWQNYINVKAYDKINKRWFGFPYFQESEGYAIKGTYDANIFAIQCARVKQFTLLISDKMVDISRPVEIYVNGVLNYKQKIGIDKRWLSAIFEKNHDRQALWLNKVEITVD
jgi:hypothetical protein